jgi:hypothetical protein
MLIELLIAALLEWDSDAEWVWLMVLEVDFECAWFVSLAVCEIVCERDFSSVAEFVFELLTSLKRECDVELLIEMLAGDNEYSTDMLGDMDWVHSWLLDDDVETVGVTDRVWGDVPRDVEADVVLDTVDDWLRVRVSVTVIDGVADGGADVETVSESSTEGLQVGVLLDDVLALNSWVNELEMLKDADAEYMNDNDWDTVADRVTVAERVIDGLEVTDAIGVSEKEGVMKLLLGLSDVESLNVASREKDFDEVCDAENDLVGLLVSEFAELLTSGETEIDCVALEVWEGDADDDGVREIVPGVINWVSDNVVESVGDFEAVTSLVNEMDDDDVQLNEDERDRLIEACVRLRANVRLGERLNETEWPETVTPRVDEWLCDRLNDDVADEDMERDSSLLPPVCDVVGDCDTLTLDVTVFVPELDAEGLEESSDVVDKLGEVVPLFECDLLRDCDDDRDCEKEVVDEASTVSDPGENENVADGEAVFDEGDVLVCDGDDDWDLLKGRNRVGLADFSEEMDNVHVGLPLGEAETLWTPDVDFVMDAEPEIVGDANPPASRALVRLRDELTEKLLVASWDWEHDGVACESDALDDVVVEVFELRVALVVDVGDIDEVTVSDSRVIEIACVAMV